MQKKRSIQAGWAAAAALGLSTPAWIGCSPDLGVAPPDEGGCATAPELGLGATVEGALSASGQQDYYRIVGSRGQVVMLDIDAESLDDVGYDPYHIDTVVTLYDASGAQIAQNNNPIFDATIDSRLYTMLPADGSYCVRVAECWTVVSDPDESCLAPQVKTYTDYVLYYRDFVDGSADQYTADIEAGDDPASAMTVGYDGDGGTYFSGNIWGTFRDESDVDVFSFTLPADINVSQGRRNLGIFYVLHSGPDGTGSTAQPGDVYVVDPLAPEVRYAELDATESPMLRQPFQLGKEYWLHVTRPPGATGANDFYFIRHDPIDTMPAESETAGSNMNDTAQAAEPVQAFDTSGNLFYFSGDLLPHTEVDHFAVSAPPGAVSVGVACWSWMQGSAIRDLTVSLLKANGEPLAVGATGVERVDYGAFTEYWPINGEAQIVARVTSTMKEPSVSQTSYTCRAYFKS